MRTYAFSRMRPGGCNRLLHEILHQADAQGFCTSLMHVHRNATVGRARQPAVSPAHVAFRREIQERSDAGQERHPS